MKIGNVTRKTKYEDLDFVNFAKISSSQLLQNDDILMTMTGDPPDVGKCNIWFSREDKQPLTYNQRVCRIVSKNTALSPLQLYVFLNSEYARYHSERYAMGIRQRNVSINDIRNIEIPIFSSEFNNLIESIISEYFISLKKSKTLYQKAENILFKSLGIIEWQTEKKEIEIKDKKYNIEKTENSKLFSQVSNTRRFDAEYWLPKYEQLNNHIDNLQVKNIIKIRKLYSVFLIKKGIEVGGKNYTTEGIPFIRVSNLSKNGFNLGNSVKYISEDFYNEIKTTFNPKVGEILFSKDGTVGISYLIRHNIKAVQSGGIVRLINESNISTDYLELVLNSLYVQNQIERKSSGALIQHFSISEIEKIKIPIIKQKDIENIEELIIKSFENDNKSKGLIKLSRQAVELAIEKGEKEAIKLIEKYKDE